MSTHDVLAWTGRPEAGCENSNSSCITTWKVCSEPHTCRGELTSRATYTYMCMWLNSTYECSINRDYHITRLTHLHTGHHETDNIYGVIPWFYTQVCKDLAMCLCYPKTGAIKNVIWFQLRVLLIHTLRPDILMYMMPERRANISWTWTQWWGMVLS